ncbi:hypothetical protein T492DRAFT_621523 [Pavlovales sp. CCMP2436]|nr:hypothetical protein T492DRAFT_621523 [Pavlovales sp. CCMP2436]
MFYSFTLTLSITLLQPRVVGVWLGALAEMAKADPALVAAVSAHTQWDANYADRKVEIVFIGVELDRKAVEAALDWALLTDAEDAQLRAAGLFACPPSARTGAFAELLAPALAQLEQCPDDAGHEHSHAHSHAHAHAEDGACASRGLPSKSDVEEMLRQTLAPSDDEEEPKAAEDAQEDANMIEPH